MDYVNYSQYTEYEQFAAYSAELRKDFGKNEVEAKEASRAKFEEQKNRMPRDQVNVLEEIKKNNSQKLQVVNQEMGRYSIEVLRKIAPESAEIHDKVEKLMKYSEKSQAGQVVYLELSPINIGKLKNDYFDSAQNPNRIDIDKLLKFIKEDSAFANYNGYMVASLHSMSLNTNEGSRILAPVELAKGTRILHLGDGNVIIDKEIPMETRGVTVVAYKGREIINWKLAQISESRYKEFISTAEKDLNKTIGEKLGVKDFNRLKLNFTSIRAASALTRAIQSVQYMADTIPPQSFKQVYNTKSHISNTHFEIKFTDRETDHKIPADVMGEYYSLGNKLYIYPVNVSLDNPTDIQRLLTAGTHEFAHAFDFVVLYHTIISRDPLIINSFSKTDEFKDLFDRENRNLTELTSPALYGQLNQVEYFAEVFVAMYSKDDNIKSLIWQQVPDTCQYITEHINKITA